MVELGFHHCSAQPWMLMEAADQVTPVTKQELGGQGQVEVTGSLALLCSSAQMDSWEQLTRACKQFSLNIPNNDRARAYQVRRDSRSASIQRLPGEF